MAHLEKLYFILEMFPQWAPGRTRTVNTFRKKSGENTVSKFNLPEYVQLILKDISCLSVPTLLCICSCSRKKSYSFHFLQDKTRSYNNFPRFHLRYFFIQKSQLWNQLYRTATIQTIVHYFLDLRVTSCISCTYTFSFQHQQWNLNNQNP